MKFISLDQSLRVTGYGIFSDDKLIASGVIKINKKIPVQSAIHEIKTSIVSIISSYSPLDFAYLEDVHFRNNVKSLISLSMLLGVLTECFVERNIICKIIHPNKWRKDLKFTSLKREDSKRRSIEIVENLTGKKCLEDEAEAICIGLSVIN